MTAKEARLIAPVMVAYSMGKKVQWYQRETGTWRDEESPSFSSALRWRVKPEPLVAYAMVVEGKIVALYSDENVAEGAKVDWPHGARIHRLVEQP